MKTFRYILLVISGTLLSVFAVYAFAIPNDLIFGGAAGIGLLLGHYTGLDISIATGILNILFLVLAYFFVGKELMIGSILSSLLYPLFLRMFEQMPQLTEICAADPLLASIIGGLAAGAGIGLVMLAGASTGGTDILCVMMHKYMHMSVGTALNLSDGLIMLGQLSFQPVKSILYGLIYTILTAHTIDAVLAAGDRKIKITVISDKYEEIRMALLKADIGVTMYQIVTGLDQKEQKSIVTIFKKNYLSTVNHIIHDADPAAFLTVENVNEVRGRGFTLERYNKQI